MACSWCATSTQNLYHYITNKLIYSCSIKPSLKKVSKYENKFAKLQEKAAKFAFANQLKQSKG